MQPKLDTDVSHHSRHSLDPAGSLFWRVFGTLTGVIVGIVATGFVLAAFVQTVQFGLLTTTGMIGFVVVSYVVAAGHQGGVRGDFLHGFLMGYNAGTNATTLSLMGPLGMLLGGVLGTTICLAAVHALARNPIYQRILGWSNWLLPMSWLVTGSGLIMWLLNGLAHLIFWYLPRGWGGGMPFFRIEGMRMDWSTGMLATRGGWVSNLNIVNTAYNMGNWAFVDRQSLRRDGSGHVVLDTAGHPIEIWYMDHEAGHNLNLAAFGCLFHFTGFIHEMATSAGPSAWAEVLAESHNGCPGMWSGPHETRRLTQGRAINAD